MRRVFIVSIETIILTFVGLCAAYLRLRGETQYQLVAQSGWLKLLMVTVVFQLAFYLFDLYDSRATRSYRRVSLNLSVALTVASVLLSILFYAVPALVLGRGVFLVHIVLTFVVISLWRVAVGWTAGHPQLGVRERVLILGSGHQAVEIARATLEQHNSGFFIVGFVDNKPELVGRSLINPSVIGITSEIAGLVERHQVDRIVVAVEDRRGQFPTEELLNLSLSGRVAVEECAQYYERLTGKIASEMLRPSWLIFSRGSRFSEFWRHVRRVLNASIALAGF